MTAKVRSEHRQSPVQHTRVPKAIQEERHGFPKFALGHLHRYEVHCSAKTAREGVRLRKRDGDVEGSHFGAELDVAASRSV